MYRITNFDKIGRRMHFIKRIISTLIYIIIIPVIIINFVILIESYIEPNSIPNFFGIKTFVIVSKSMEPTIMTGDAIFIKQIKKI